MYDAQQTKQNYNTKSTMEKCIITFCCIKNGNTVVPLQQMFVIPRLLCRKKGFYGSLTGVLYVCLNTVILRHFLTVYYEDTTVTGPYPACSSCRVTS